MVSFKGEKLKDINKLYNILELGDESIKLKRENLVVKVYIYEIEEIAILNLSKESKNNIVNGFIELLRQLEVDIQMFCMNKKLNISEYISENLKLQDDEKNNVLRKVHKIYVENLKKKLENEKIYITDYYIVISIEENKNIKIEDVEKPLEKLKDIGCDFKRVIGKKNLKNILYQSINKEYI